MKKFSIFVMLALMLTGALAIAASASSVPVNIQEVQINGNEVRSGELRNLERGEDLEVQVRLNSTSDAEDIEIETEVDGVEYNGEDARAETDLFDVTEGQTYFKTMTIQLPDNMDREEYTVRITASDKRNNEVEFDANIAVDTPRHELRITDTLFSPGTEVRAGRSLLASVRVDNFGQMTEEDVKVNLNVPELGISDTDYIEEIESDDEKMSQELFMRVPQSAKSGEYKATVTVEYDEGTETTTQDYTLNVLESREAQSKDKTVISVGPQSQNVVAGGKEAVYPVAISNEGTESKTYSLNLNAGDWASARLSSNVLVVDSGETKVAYAFISADKDAKAGEKTSSLTLNSGDKTLKQLSLKTNVAKPKQQESTGIGLKEGLQIGLVVLVVLLVIIGLIVGFSQMNQQNRETDEEEYY